MVDLGSAVKSARSPQVAVWQDADGASQLFMDPESNSWRNPGKHNPERPGAAGRRRFIPGVYERPCLLVAVIGMAVAATSSRLNNQFIFQQTNSSRRRHWKV